MAKRNFVVTTSDSRYLAELVSKELGAEIIEIEDKRFPDQERYLRAQIEDQSVLFNSNIIFVGSSHNDESIAFLYRLGCMFSKKQTRRRIFCMPFFGYSTMEHEVEEGEVVTAKVICRQFSSIPNTGMGNTFIHMDLHVGGMAHYYEEDCTSLELNALGVLKEELDRLGVADKDVVFGTADLGRSKQVELLQEAYNADIAFVAKQRKGTETKVLAAVGDVKGKIVIIYDDMTRSAGTICKAAQAYIDGGATDVIIMLSHMALYNDGVIERFKQAPVSRVITTNSHPMSQQVKHDELFTVLDISPLLVDYIQKIIR